MNPSNLYNYSILIGTWNDLDYDVLLLVKEYLRIHLDRRLLNKDYNVFLQSIYNKIKNIPFYLQNNNDYVLLTRDGLKSYNKSGYVTSFRRQLYYRKYCIDDFIFPKYYILCMKIHIKSNGFSYLDRINLINHYEKIHNSLSETTDELSTIRTIRMLMDFEEKLIQS